MKGEVLAAGLLLATLAFALAFLSRRTGWASCAAVITTLIPAALLAPAIPDYVAFAGCWLSLIALALSVYWPAMARRYAALPVVAAGMAGLWSGLLLALDQRWQVFPLAAGFVVMALAAQALSARGGGIALRVATSWLLAVALLVGAIPHLVSHPGYEPDHRE